MFLVLSNVLNFIYILEHLGIYYSDILLCFLFLVLTVFIYFNIKAVSILVVFFIFSNI